MNRFIHGVTRAISETFELPEPILEVGSRQVHDAKHLAELRPLFADKRYIGLDLEPGPGVDCIGNVEALPQPSRSVGTVLILSTMEHVRHFWRGFEEIYRVLRPDGALLVSCPFYFHVHNFPSDYWRFTPQAMELLLDRYPHRIIGQHGPPRRPAHIWALAFREEHAPITHVEFERYKSLVGRYARQPLPWTRSWRYRVGSWVCGRRPFAPFLDRERWETECRTSMAS